MKLAPITTSFFVAVSLSCAAPVTVDYNRDVRPILSDKCFKCHGPDEPARKGDRRLDKREDALTEHDGVRAVVPSKPEESDVISRIESLDNDDVMPPKKSNLQLTKDEKSTLRRWIAEGAEYQPHWSLVAPHSSSGSIDSLVRERLKQQGLAPTKEATPETLIRRMSLDLTGLPPTPEEVASFVNKWSESSAEERTVKLEALADHFLASNHYGERMALDWLDAARYADSNGYFLDNARQSWPWRDWVIKAFNRNQRFDQFTIEQIAGDLLPSATLEQKIATGFNRNHMVTGETGIIDEEYRVEYVADRLETTATVWLGLTVGCSRCHDHKYDPLTQREYYQLFAFFNNGPDTGLVKEDDPPPTLDVATQQQRAELAKLSVARKNAEANFARLTQPLAKPLEAWAKDADKELAPLEDSLVTHLSFETDLASADDTKSRAVVKGNRLTFNDGVLGHAAQFDATQHIELPAELAIDANQPWSIGLWMKPTGSLNCVLSKIDPQGDRRGFELLWQKGRLQINLVHRWGSNAIQVVTKEPAKKSDWHQVIVSYDGSSKAAGLRVFVDGEGATLNVILDTLHGSISNAQPLRIGRRDNGLGFYGQLDELRLYRRSMAEDDASAWYWSDRVRGILAVAADKRDANQKRTLLDYFVEHDSDDGTKAARAAVLRSIAEEEKYRALLPKTLVMQELPKPRVTHVLKRGQYDQLGDEVHAEVPASLPPLPSDVPRNRLGLARWLVSPTHPLTARVEVNRLWQQCFGEGLVRSMNDFGTQGEPPTHPELLDWLATLFVASGWDVKAMLKLIVTSATYRQSSVATSAMLASDPDNRLLAHGPRFRLSAEAIRDQALAASGLLAERIGGPSVKPYQPPGLWEAVSYDGELTYQQDLGESLWRRSLYTFWKRQSPPPTMLTFDGPTRETCTVRRARTNTPMQALVLLNDVTFIEAARVLASNALHLFSNDDDRLLFAFRRILVRSPEPAERSLLLQLLKKQRVHFAQEIAAPKDFVSIGASTLGQDLSPAELAAWTSVTQTLLNLDEAITRR